MRKQGINKIIKKIISKTVPLFPRDFACKVRDRMRHDRNPLLVTVQDKFAVREYARGRGVRTARLLQVADSVDDLSWDRLPPECFIKTNNACGRNVRRTKSLFYHFGHGAELMLPNGEMDEAKAGLHLLSQEKCIRRCREWLCMAYRKEEWVYHQMVPKLLVEETLTPRNGGELMDFRFFTFDGSVRAINVGSPAYRYRGENVFLDPAWNPFGLTRYMESPNPVPERPDTLPEMLDIAAKLARGLDFVRVDLYDTTDGVILGEMTVYPEAGMRGTPTCCSRFNRWLGEQWKQEKRYYP